MPYNKNDPKSIQAMFGSIAKSYNRTNAVLSFQMHRYWNKKLVKTVQEKGLKEAVLLDLCCGTGEIAYTYFRQKEAPSKAYLIDFCDEMLECAKARAVDLPSGISQKLSYIQGDAQNIPLPAESVSCTTIAYGIRNVKDPAKCIQEVFRVLKPGGILAILELTEPNNSFLRLGHRLYLSTVLPLMGKCLTSNQEAYEYLCNSIHSFVKPAALEQMMLAAGYVDIQRLPLNGGIATIIIAKKAT